MVDNRILKITLDRPETHTPLTIIETYAPHQGYSNHEKNKHWEAVHKTLTETPRQHMTIWGADANGQLGREKNQPEKYDKIIGPHTNNSSPEKGNGVKMANLCKQHLMIPMNTWKRAKIHPKEKKQIQESHEPEKQKRHTKTKHNHMGKPRWKNGTTNRLHINKPQVQKRSNQSKRSKRMASEHGTTTTTQSHQNGHKTQAHEKLQKTNPQKPACK